MVKNLLYVLAGLSIALALFFFVLTPNVSRFRKENPKKTSLMEFREAEWKAKGRKVRIHQNWVPFSRISPYVVKAVIIAEDDKFWSHEGFDYEAIQEAVEKNIKAGRFKAGGSTISQQLAKNLYLTPKKSPVRKIREAAITWKIERSLSKRRILELYLNVVEWGEGVFGIEAASLRYFGHPAIDVSPMEAARLVAVLPNPRKYNPAGDQKYVLNRSNVIYDIMVKRGIVVPEYEEVSQDAGQSEAIEAGPQPSGDGAPKDAASDKGTEAPQPEQDAQNQSDRQQGQQANPQDSR